MIPWELVGSAPLPGKGEALHFYKRGAEYSLRVETRELMNSRVHASEDALADLACARIAGRSHPRILIGGLGMGYTLAAALRRLGARSQVVVAELVPAVVAWNRGPLGPLAGHPLQDERVIVREDDVAQILQREHDAYDAILLDVDNGPEDLLRTSNDWLYGRTGLNATFAALRPKGVLAVWSAATDRVFAQRLRRAGFQVHEIPVRARGARGGRRHTIWIAERGS